MTKELSLIIRAIDQATGPTAAAAAGVSRFAITVVDSSTKAGKAADQAAEKWTRTMTVVKGAAAGAAVAIAGVLLAPGDSLLGKGVSWLGDQLSGPVARLDEIGKAARRLGTSVEFMSKLAYVAGVNNIAFKELATGVATAEKNIGQFLSLGGGKAADVLANFRGELADSAGNMRSMSDLLPVLADRIRALPIEEQQLAVQKIFGNEAFLNIIQGGRVGFAEGFARAQKLNVVYTREMTGAAEEYLDRVRDVEEAWMGVKVTLAADILPLLSQGLDLLAQITAQAGPRARNISALLGQSFSTDAQTRLYAQGQLDEILHQTVRVAGVTATQTGKVAGTMLIEGTIIGIKTAGPSLAESLIDAYVDALNGVKDWAANNPALTAAFPQLRALAGLSVPPLTASGQARQGMAMFDAQIGKIRGEIDGIKARYTLGNSDPSSLSSLAGVTPDARVAKLESELVGLQGGRNALLLMEQVRLRQRAAAAQPEIDRALASLTESAGGAAAAVGPELSRLWEMLGTPEFVGPPAPGEDAAPRTPMGSLAKEIKDAGRAWEAGKDPISQAIDAMKIVDSLRVRSLESRGDERGAGRERLLQQQAEEVRHLGELGSIAEVVRGPLEAQQNMELRSFDLRTRLLEIDKRLEEAGVTYRRGLEDRSNLVQAGTLREFQATRQNLASADALRELGETARTELADLPAQMGLSVEQQQAVQFMLEGTKQKLEEIMRLAATARDRPEVTFFEGMDRAFERFREKADDVGVLGEEAGRDITEAVSHNLGDAIFQAGQNINNLGDIINNFAQNSVEAIGKVASQMLAMRIVAGTLGLFGLGGGGAAAGLAGAALGGGRALGGPVLPGGVYTVGERGPERLVMGSRGGYVIPGAGGGGGAGVVVHQTVQISGSRADESTLRDFKRATVDAVREAMARSPSFRGEMRSALA